LERGDERNAIYTDFEKAFDKVPHQLLLQKLKYYNANPSVINWIKSFLCFRKQKFELNGFFSEWRDVISGIPQGKPLAPILLIIYINDLPDICKHFATVYCTCLLMMQNCINMYYVMMTINLFSLA